MGRSSPLSATRNDSNDSVLLTPPSCSRASPRLRRADSLNIDVSAKNAAAETACLPYRPAPTCLVPKTLMRSEIS